MVKCLTDSGVCAIGYKRFRYCIEYLIKAINMRAEPVFSQVSILEEEE